MNGLKINTAKEFRELFEKDEPLAMGLLFDAIKETQKKVECRLPECQKEFVSRKQVKYVVGLLISFLIGSGLLNWHFTSKVLALIP